MLFQLLQDWYFEGCDGDWEHTSGIDIQTMDNPGWSFSAEVWDSDQAGLTLDEAWEGPRTPEEELPFNLYDARFEWYKIWTESGSFRAYCSPKLIDYVIARFLWDAGWREQLRALRLHPNQFLPKAHPSYQPGPADLVNLASRRTEAIAEIEDRSDPLAIRTQPINPTRFTAWRGGGHFRAYLAMAYPECIVQELGQDELIGSSDPRRVLTLIRIDVSKARSVVTLTREMNRALQCPSWSGENWMAMEENCQDLSWLPGSVLVVLFEGFNVLQAVKPGLAKRLLEVLGPIAEGPLDLRDKTHPKRFVLGMWTA